MGRTVTFKNEAKNLAGTEIKVGDKAPDFSCLIGLDVNTLAHTGAKPKLFSVVPSLDTGVCSMQTKKFESELADVNDKVSTYTVSLDLPFAQKRFCGAEGIENVENLSDFKTGSFGKDYGLEIVDSVLAGLHSRVVIVLDENGNIIYEEQVPEIADEPNYEAALASL